MLLREQVSTGTECCSENKGWGVYHGNVWGLDDPSLKTLLTHAYFLPVLIFTHGVLLFCPSLVFCSLEVFVLVLVYVLVSICLAGLCAV